MNKRVLIGSAVGAVVYFIWGVLAWTVLPLHTPTLHRFTDERSVGIELYNQAPGPGWYSIPSRPELSRPEDEEELSATEKKQLMTDWITRHEEGPVVNVFYNEGGKPMPPQLFVRGMAINLVAALLVSILLGWSNCHSYVKRVWFVVTVGAFAAVVTHMANWNWMWFPLDYTLGMCADVLLGWSLVGLAMAAIVRPETPKVTEVTPQETIQPSGAAGGSRKKAAAKKRE